jgi:hypothetical protein
MTADAHEHIRSRVRGLLIAVADQLPAVTAGLVDELLDANEQGVAVEMLSEMLVESNAQIEMAAIYATPGVSFDLWYAGRIVGHGQVVEVCDDLGDDDLSR